MATAEQETPGTGMAVTAAPSRSVGLLRPVAPVGDIIRAQEETRDFIARALQVGRDYGVIPGTERKDKDGKDISKKNLLKAGSERVCAGFGVRPDYQVLEQEIDHDREVPWKKSKKVWLNRHKGDREFRWEDTTGFSTGLYRYVVLCTLIHVESGVIVGSGIGSCSTMEGKYVDRPRESENTVLKMAKKRAFVDATLTTFGLSDAFTQDLEDMRDAEEGEATVVASEQYATIERVREVRAQLVEMGATKAWLKAFDEGAQEPRTEGWLQNAIAKLNEALAEKKAKAAQQQAQDAADAGGTPEQALAGVGGAGDAPDLPFD